MLGSDYGFAYKTFLMGNLSYHFTTNKLCIKNKINATINKTHKMTHDKYANKHKTIVININTTTQYIYLIVSVDSERIEQS